MGRAATKAHYPTKAQIERAIAAAKGLGLDVAGFQVWPDGSIKVVEARMEKAAPANDFDRYEAEL